MAKLLLVEDDVELTAQIRTWLEIERYTVDVAHTGQQAMNSFRSEVYDLIILNLNLPDISGLDLCRQFRKLHGRTPIVLLTNRGSINDKEAGLDCGADDYLTKPFNMKELSARIRALLRRSSSPT